MSQARRLSAVRGDEGPPGAPATPGGERPLTGDMRRRRGATMTLDTTDEVTRAVAAAKAGDRDAIRYLYVRSADHVYHYVRTIVRDAHEAEDVTQQVFAKLMTILPKYEQREVPFAAWLLRVARNVALDHMRSIRAVPSGDVPDSAANADDFAGDRLLALREVLDTLPRDQRAVLVMRHLLGLSPAEIAQRMERSEAAVHGLHHRGRAAVRKRLLLDAWAPATMTDPSR